MVDTVANKLGVCDTCKTGILCECLAVVTDLLLSGIITKDKVLSIIGNIDRFAAHGFLIAIRVENCCNGTTLQRV
jgi:hypothetical protein